MADLGEEAFSSQMKVVTTFLRLLEELMRNKQLDLRYGTKTQRRGILRRMKDFVGGMHPFPSRIAQMAITEHIFQPTMANVNKLKRNRKAISKRLSSIIG